MILAGGKIYPTEKQNEILASLETEIGRTLLRARLSSETVVEAFDRLSKKICEGVFDELIASMDIDGAEAYVQLAVKLLSRENILHKLQTELGETPCKTSPPR